MGAALWLAAPCAAAVYDVGPNRPYPTLGAVPWRALTAGDTVRIHARAEPYREKITMGGRGTAAAPIVMQGVADADGRLPVMDGENAVAPLELEARRLERAVVHIGSFAADAAPPEHIVIENLDIRGGRPPFTFSDAAGARHAYTNYAASIWIESGRHLIIRRCRLHDSGHGLFVSPDNGRTADVRVEYCHLFDNGNPGSLFEHNAYTECDGIVFQFNRFGPLRADCAGNALKDRSAGTVIRYNWVEGGNRQLDLVDSTVLTNAVSAGVLVYGNVLIEPPAAGNNQICHYGGDSTTLAWYRRGPLLFYHNTVVSRRTDRTVLFRLSAPTHAATVECHQNIVWAAAGTLVLAEGAATPVELSRNWLSAGWIAGEGTNACVREIDDTLAGQAPGFVDDAAQQFGLTVASPCVAAGNGIPITTPYPEWEYVPHQQSRSRPRDEALDLGAFEREP